MNIFETITRRKLRFDSVRGALSIEQLWDAPLVAKDGFSLDEIAKQANRNLKEAGEETFVATASNPARAALELRLEAVKYIIGVKEAEAAERAKAADRAQKKARLTELLSKKQDEKLEGLTEAEILAEIQALG